MRLDEKGLEAATRALILSDEPGLTESSLAELMDSNRPTAHGVITAYLTSIVPGDVRELATELSENADFHRDAYLKLQDPNTGNHLGWTHGEYLAQLIDRASTALLTLSAENAELKSRLSITT